MGAILEQLYLTIVAVVSLGGFLALARYIIYASNSRWREYETLYSASGNKKPLARKMTGMVRISQPGYRWGHLSGDLKSHRHLPVFVGVQGPFRRIAVFSTRQAGRRRWVCIGVCLALLCQSLLSGWEGASNLNNWRIFRYRLTIIAVVDGKERTGTSVLEVRYWLPRRGPMSCCEHTVDGRAPIVDLGDSGWLVAHDANSDHFKTDSSVVVSSFVGLPTETFGVPPRDLPSQASATNLLQRTVRKDSRLVVPGLAWLPRDTISGEDAVPIHWYGVQKVSGFPVEVISILLEPTMDPVSRLDQPAPQWLQSLRSKGCGGLVWAADRGALRLEACNIEKKRHY